MVMLSNQFESTTKINFKQQEYFSSPNNNEKIKYLLSFMNSFYELSKQKINLINNEKTKMDPNLSQISKNKTRRANNTNLNTTKNNNGHRNPQQINENGLTVDRIVLQLFIEKKCKFEIFFDQSPIHKRTNKMNKHKKKKKVQNFRKSKANLRLECDFFVFEIDIGFKLKTRYSDCKDAQIIFSPESKTKFRFYITYEQQFELESQNIQQRNILQKTFQMYKHYYGNFTEIHPISGKILNFETEIESLALRCYFNKKCTFNIQSINYQKYKENEKKNLKLYNQNKNNFFNSKLILQHQFFILFLKKNKTKKLEWRKYNFDLRKRIPFNQNLLNKKKKINIQIDCLKLSTKQKYNLKFQFNNFKKRLLFQECFLKFKEKRSTQDNQLFFSKFSNQDNSNFNHNQNKNNNRQDKNEKIWNVLRDYPESQILTRKQQQEEEGKKQQEEQQQSKQERKRKNNENKKQLQILNNFETINPYSQVNYFALFDTLGSSEIILDRLKHPPFYECIPISPLILNSKKAINIKDQLNQKIYKSLRKQEEIFSIKINGLFIQSKSFQVSTNFQSKLKLKIHCFEITFHLTNNKNSNYDGKFNHSNNFTNSTGLHNLTKEYSKNQKIFVHPIYLNSFILIDQETDTKILFECEHNFNCCLVCNSFLSFRERYARWLVSKRIKTIKSNFIYFLIPKEPFYSKYQIQRINNFNLKKKKFSIFDNKMITKKKSHQNINTNRDNEIFTLMIFDSFENIIGNIQIIFYRQFFKIKFQNSIPTMKRFYSYYTKFISFNKDPNFGRFHIDEFKFINIRFFNIEQRNDFLLKLKQQQLINNINLASIKIFEFKCKLSTNHGTFEVIIKIKSDYFMIITSLDTLFCEYSPKSFLQIKKKKGINKLKYHFGNGQMIKLLFDNFKESEKFITIIQDYSYRFFSQTIGNNYQKCIGKISNLKQFSTIYIGDYSLIVLTTMPIQKNQKHRQLQQKNIKRKNNSNSLKKKNNKITKALPIRIDRFDIKKSNVIILPKDQKKIQILFPNKTYFIIEFNNYQQIKYFILFFKQQIFKYLGFNSKNLLKSHIIQNYFDLFQIYILNSNYNIINIAILKLFPNEILIMGKTLENNKIKNISCKISQVEIEQSEIKNDIIRFGIINKIEKALNNGHDLEQEQEKNITKYISFKNYHNRKIFLMKYNYYKNGQIPNNEYFNNKNNGGEKNKYSILSSNQKLFTNFQNIKKKNSDNSNISNKLKKNSLFLSNSSLTSDKSPESISDSSGNDNEILFPFKAKGNHFRLTFLNKQYRKIDSGNLQFDFKGKNILINRKRNSNKNVVLSQIEKIIIIVDKKFKNNKIALFETFNSNSFIFSTRSYQRKMELINGLKYLKKIIHNNKISKDIYHPNDIDNKEDYSYLKTKNLTVNNQNENFAFNVSYFNLKGKELSTGEIEVYLKQKIIRFKSHSANNKQLNSIQKFIHIIVDLNLSYIKIHLNKHKQKHSLLQILINNNQSNENNSFICQLDSRNERFQLALLIDNMKIEIDTTNENSSTQLNSRIRKNEKNFKVILLNSKFKQIDELSMKIQKYSYIIESLNKFQKQRFYLFPEDEIQIDKKFHDIIHVCLYQSEKYSFKVENNLVAIYLSEIMNSMKLSNDLFVQK
ncbi:microtubule-associated protein [Anaeramoeba flamelloides]|uniref:Microtubule-associated protein n=1 Tax=Anaeramoeba flamelloides TaxID=1746091 RepID=A0ABQ8X870_9EUKA|nr:microtubule-associated protein [Anaeramoeba flamelloides]